MIERLNKYIKDKGLKKAKVAEILGCSVGHLSYILNEHREPSIELTVKIKALIG